MEHQRQILLFAVALALLVLRADTGAAQDGPTLVAQIQQGSCAENGATAFQLSGLGASTTLDGTPTPASMPVGVGDTLPVVQSATTLDAAFSELVDEPHALTISAAAGRTSRVVACGEIGGMLTAQMAGMVMPGDQLAVALRPINDSGYAGIALITANGLTTTVNLFLAEGMADDPAD